jgi:hypothetical protein
MPCEKCAEFGGRWMETPRGLVPCRCPEGNALREKPVVHKPVLTSQAATVFVEMLASIPFFPSESGARLAIGDEMRAMCAGPKEADWLVTRMRRLYNRWPGPTEMRRVYVSKFKAWDGIMPLGESEHYPDHIPIESETRESRLIAGPTVKRIGEGRKPETRHEHPADADWARRAAGERE